MGKFYAVKEGRKTGVFNTWRDCEKQIKGFSNAKYKSFTTYEEAKNYLFDSNFDKNSVNTEADIVAYIDGGYDNKKNYYSFASIIFYKGEKIIFATAENKSDILKQRNVAGEIKSAIHVIDFALRNKVTSIEIFYDYAGIENWATKAWQAKNPFTQNYVDYIQGAKKQLDIIFSKVKSHSGNKYNDEVDLLAKQALENPDKKIEGIYKLETEGNDILNEKTEDSSDLFKSLKGTKRSINLGLLIEDKLYSTDKIYNTFKRMWTSQNRKLNEYIEIKSAFDVEKQVILIRILNKNGKWESLQIKKGDLDLYG